MKSSFFSKESDDLNKSFSKESDDLNKSEAKKSPGEAQKASSSVEASPFAVTSKYAIFGQLYSSIQDFVQENKIKISGNDNEDRGHERADPLFVLLMTDASIRELEEAIVYLRSDERFNDKQKTELTGLISDIRKAEIVRRIAKLSVSSSSHRMS